MESLRQRRKLTREFKVEASRQPGRSVGEVAKSLDLGEGLLRRWREEFDSEGASAFAWSGKPSVLEDEVRRLRAENERLRMEREILKKATAFFVKESR